MQDSLTWVAAGEARPPSTKKKQQKQKVVSRAPVLVSEAFAPVDVSGVEAKSELLKGAKLNVCSYGSGRRSKEAVARLVKELGGTVSHQALNRCRRGFLSARK